MLTSGTNVPAGFQPGARTVRRTPRSRARTAGPLARKPPLAIPWQPYICRSVVSSELQRPLGYLAGLTVPMNTAPVSTATSRPASMPASIASAEVSNSPFVTGAASGIGRATALAFAREGANVVVADIDHHGNQDTRKIENLGGQALAVSCDVTRSEDVQAALSKTVERVRAHGLRLLQRRRRAAAQGIQREQARSV